MYYFPRCRLCQWSVAATIILGIAPTLAADESAGKTSTGELKQKAAQLVAQLGAPALAARQAAERDLLEIGVPALAALEAARDSDNIEIRLRAAEIAGKINERRIADAEIHVVGLYEAGSADGKVTVRIESATRPVVLVVCARDIIHWEVQTAPGVELIKVFASGYLPQKVTGTSASVQLLSVEGDQPAEVRRKAFYAYQNRGIRYDEMRQRLKELTGKEIDSFQGRYDGEGKPFVIGAK